MKRRILILLITLLLLGVVLVVWEINDWPPGRLILKYGFPPTGGPTGNKREIEGIEFIELKPGYFRMGSPCKCDLGYARRISSWLGFGDAPEHEENNCPPQWMEIEAPFWIARREVSIGEFQRYQKSYESSYVGGRPSQPVLLMFMSEAEGFCDWLTSRSGQPCRLPTEAEWEYACRAGTMGGFSFGSERAAEAHAQTIERVMGGVPTEKAFTVHLASSILPCGALCPNPWGLHDMHGNVPELVKCVSFAPSEGMRGGRPDGPKLAQRGGGYANRISECTSSGRKLWWEFPTAVCGFRPVLTILEEE
jgi:formylglycine-generating enzyme required for sulfatase activity